MTTAQAVDQQLALRAAVRTEPLDIAKVRLVAGADISYRRWDEDLRVAITVVSLPDLALAEVVTLTTRSPFPYVPGLLSFRELPPLLAAWQQLRVRPDALLCDGHGRAHPRRFGLACHAGLTLDLPSVGCAKSVLVGRAEPPGDWRGATSELRLDGEVIGRALRTRAGVKPVYVSVGHRVTLDDAVALVLACQRKYRLPEPTRLAHQQAQPPRA
ncbi:MAG: endonuclease V [Armatimonadetes bacterium]|nr:endonuclease V [Armatimonadota bacterium]